MHKKHKTAREVLSAWYIVLGCLASVFRGPLSVAHFNLPPPRTPMLTRYFALVPAAGHSSRMGTPKLLLPLGGQPLLGHTLQAWLASQVDRIVVTVRAADQALLDVVQPLCEQSGRIDLVTPRKPPPDMKASLQIGLQYVEQYHGPNVAAFLVAPADMPQLSSGVIDLLLATHPQRPDHILVPTLDGKRGHPVLFPWRFAAEVQALAADEGLNAVVHRHEPTLVSCDQLAVAPALGFADIDTPDEYRRLAAEYQGKRSAPGDG